ncbi:MAG: SAM-dependent chlorinase/fluorinase [Bacteroidetes bacterium]|nr:SAM-dependent chlorinase/fluorinase [Bacteroidota bacterium]
MAKPVFIHILSDAGSDPLETTAAQAMVYRFLPEAKLIYSARRFSSGDVVSSGILLRLLHNRFPTPTIHFCYTRIKSRDPGRYTAAFTDTGVFFAPDFGILPLALEGLQVRYYGLDYLPQGADALQDLYLPAAMQVLDNNYQPLPHWTEKPAVSSPLVSPTTGDGHYRLTVVYCDDQGNAYLNMDKNTFETITAGKKWYIRPAFKVAIERISTTYRDEDDGAALALFGAGDLLQIAICDGSARRYLGLDVAKMVLLEVL